MRPLAGLRAGQGPARGNAAAQPKQATRVIRPGQRTHGNVSRPINSVVLSLYSRGMTTRDIEAHLEEVYGAKVSRELISNITEVVVDEIKAWQSRPLDEVYPQGLGKVHFTWSVVV